MNERERLLSVLRLEETDRPPCICPMQTGTIDLMKLSGAFWPQAHDKPEVMAKLALAANRFSGLESVRVPFETSVEASAFGASVLDRSIRRQPEVLRSRVPRREDFQDMEIPDPTKDGKAPVVLEALRLLKKEATDLPIICGVVSPHMLAFQLIGDQRALLNMYTDPIFLRAVLHKAKTFCIAYATEAFDAGADVIALVDSLASGDFLTPAQYREFALPYHAKVCKEVEKLGAPTILHICGDTTVNLPFMVQTRANGISVDHEVKLTYAKNQAAGKAAVIGNVCPTETLLEGTVEAVRSETLHCLEDGTDAVAPGCGLALETPLSNLKTMVETTKMYGLKVR